MDPVQRHFLDERVFIGKSTDPAALLDRMADYRDDLRAAVARGDDYARLRANDLLEMAETRITRLKARALRPRRSPPVAPEPTPTWKPEEPVVVEPAWESEEPGDAPDEPEPDREPGWDEADSEVEDAEPPAPAPAYAPVDDEADQAERERTQTRERAALDRGHERLRQSEKDLKAAQSDRERVTRSRKAAERQRATVADEREKIRQRRAALEAAKEARRKAELERIAAATREAEEKAKRERIAAEAEIERQRIARERLAAEESALAKERADLARLAAEEAAASKAESIAVDSPRGPAEAENASSPTLPTPPRPSARAPAASEAVSLTGSDLLKYRAEHGLTQRAAAQNFGVAHGTIAKAEIGATRPLGDTLREALGRALREARA